MVNRVVPYNPAWKAAYEREADAICQALRSSAIELHHIGSTSIEGILAKPIIDLMGVAIDLTIVDANSRALEELGYEVMGEYGIPGRRYFRKSDNTGKRTHHLHVFAKGSEHPERHLAFRDYLRAHPEKAAEYSELKAKLTSSNTTAWGSYVDGKAPFVSTTEQAAIRWYRSTAQKDL